MPKLSLSARSDFLRSLVAAFPDAMVLIDQAGTIIAYSDSEKAMLGYSGADLMGQTLSTLFPLAERERYDASIRHYIESTERHGGSYDNLVQMQRKNGDIIPVDLSLHESLIDGVPMFICFMHNATVREEQRQRLSLMSAELAHASRLSSMGLLSSAIAHELNQPLTAIRNYVETVQAIARGSGPLDREMLAEVMNACDHETARAGEIIRRLRQFISRGDPEHTRESLVALITDAITLALANGESAGTQIEMSIDDTAETVLVDGIQIQQVIFNLLRNAIQAMGGKSDQRLRISSTGRDQMVEVVIEDSGGGISPEYEMQLFLPFSTTKIDGMGLGLSIVKMIVEAHGGRIWLGSSDLGGCAFHFTIPVMQSMMESMP
ncbi:MAG TPA: ATP-binding protein [Novosphingobium sp.]|nr:ATP-binding protein [Novosphingobium sp.]